MSDYNEHQNYGPETLGEPELLGIRNRWTARGAQAARSQDELSEQLAEAQRDIGKLLRHLDAFSGPPVIDD